MFIDSS